MKLSCPYCGTSSFVPDSIALVVARELRCQLCRTEIAFTQPAEAVEGAPTRVELIHGRYEKLAAPTDSGLGSVYPAYDRTLRTFVAIKELGDARLLRRFEREIELGKVLTHENIVVIYDHGENRETRFLSLEYLDGTSLDRLLRSDQLSFEHALDLMIMACQGLEYVHVRGVAHRALKPANMFITSDGVLKLMNFGSAASEADEPRALDEDTLGMRAYMAPEQLSSPSLVSQRADVWSLGAVAYQVFTGVLPSFAPALDEPEAARERLTLASALNPRLPTELDAVLLRALADRPDHRFADAGELCERLMALRRKHLPQPAVAPITSVRPGAPAPSQTPRRQLLLAGLAAAALLVAGALLVRGGGSRPATSGAPSLARDFAPPSPASVPPAAASGAAEPTAPSQPTAAPALPEATPQLAASASGLSTRLSTPRCPAGAQLVPARELQLAQPRPRTWTFAEHTLPTLPVDGFCIDPRPVSVAAYGRCVEAGSCAPHEPQCTPSSEPGAAMKCVSWQAAQRYCATRGGELPSVAQWEAYAQTSSSQTDSPEWAQDAFPPAVFAARCAEQNPALCDGHLWRKAGRLPTVGPDGKSRLAFSWNRGAATSASGYDYVSFRCVVPPPPR
jgi:serine/threonine protein kinase